jgi:hypothetical protein
MEPAISPVWTVCKASTVTQVESEQPLRDLCAEPFFVEEQAVIEDDAVVKQYAIAVLPNNCFRVEPVFRRHDSVMSRDHPVFEMELVQDMQHLCCLYST